MSKEKGVEVYSCLVNTGGFSPEELVDVEKKAYELGVTKHICIDETNNYYQNCIKYLIFGNVLKNNTYPLSVSAERAFQAMAIAQYAKDLGADYIAHGSTGAGNDQVRFDMIFGIVLPGVTVITPIRDNKLSRDQEIEFLKGFGVERDWAKSVYSINKGIWGTSVGGKETLTSHLYLPEEAFPTQVTKTEPEEIELYFEKGELKGVNGVDYANPVGAIQAVEDIAAPFGIGRDIHVGDTIVGIKGRVGFEAAAPYVIIKAHHLLEKHTLTKSQQYWKDQLATTYGNLLHEGQFMEPVMRNIETFMTETQTSVSGTVKVYLAPYRFHMICIESPHDMMASKAAQYGEMNEAWDGSDVRGFSKIASVSNMIHNSVNKK